MSLLSLLNLFKTPLIVSSCTRNPTEYFFTGLSVTCRGRIVAPLQYNLVIVQLYQFAPLPNYLNVSAYGNITTRIITQLLD